MLNWARGRFGAGEFGAASPVLILAAAAVLSLAFALVLILTDSLGVSAAILTAAVPVTLGLVGQFVSSDRQNRREIEARLRERKSAVYEEFIRFWMDLMMLKEKREKLVQNQSQLLEEMNNLSKPMMLWASNEVVRSYSEFRRKSSSADSNVQERDSIDTLIRFEQMLLLMREDMGHDPGALRQFDLLSFFVNDIHKYDKHDALE
jgi:hypothetical protein